MRLSEAPRAIWVREFYGQSCAQNSCFTWNIDAGDTLPGHTARGTSQVNATTERSAYYVVTEPEARREDSRAHTVRVSPPAFFANGPLSA